MYTRKLLFIKLFTILLIFLENVHCEDSNNNTATSTTTLAPVEEKTDNICKSCACKDSSVDCTSRNISSFFTVADWAGIRKDNPKTINMSNNAFTTVTPFPNLSVIILDLSHGKINKIEDSSFIYLQNMQVLDLSYNNISSAALLPDVFRGVYEPEEYLPLRSLRVLNLSYNDLHSLRQDVFEHTPEIIELRLKGNSFTVIDVPTTLAISNLGNLKILDLSDCQLKSLGEHTFHALKYLEWLDISSNELSKIPPSLEDTHILKYLSIAKNPIKYIEKNSSVYSAFSTLPNLIEIDISYMPILEEIKAHSLSGLTGVKIVHLNNNPALTIIDATAFERRDETGEGEVWPQIEELYLERNNLSVIHNTLIGRWDLLKSLDIRHNPFLCDCTTQWMVDKLAPIILEKSDNISSDIICNEPIEMRGKSMIHLETIHNHMRCSDAYGSRPERDAALLVGTLIGALIAMPIILGIMLLYRKGYFNCCGGGGPAAFSRTFYKRTDTNDFL